jgi:hypothetical protein
LYSEFVIAVLLVVSSKTKPSRFQLVAATVHFFFVKLSHLAFDLVSTVGADGLLDFFFLNSRLLLKQSMSHVPIKVLVKQLLCDDKVLQKGSLSESPQNISQENGAQLREANGQTDQCCARTASVTAQECFNTSTVTRQNQDPGDEISDGDSGFNGNARSPRHCAMKTPSERSPSSDTLNSKVSDWSSSHFHDHTAESQRETC